MKFTDNGFEYYLEELTNMELIFAFMPYIHSENKIYREKSKKILEKIEEKLGNNNEVFKKILKNYDNHEQIFNKFGRFPKRNDVLNRKTNKEETMYLHMRKNKYC